MAATANDLTRQQLDELDALLQRMLNVPGPKPEGEPASTWRADPPMPMSPPHFTAQELHAVETPLPLMQIEPEPETLSWPLPPEPAIELLPEPKPRLSPALWPLFSVNWLLECTLKLFGPPGEFLMRRTGKNLLGACGVTMLIVAGLWTAQGQGLVKLPIEKLLKR